MKQTAVEALERARRLGELGVEVRSGELEQAAKDLQAFAERGGNRRMRRAAKRAKRP